MKPTKIEEQWQEADGYWIALKPGWKNFTDPLGAEHHIVESNRKKAIRKAELAIPCDCEECCAHE